MAGAIGGGGERPAATVIGAEGGVQEMEIVSGECGDGDELMAE